MTVSLQVALEADKPAFRAMLDDYMVEHYALVDPEGHHDPHDFPTFDLYWTEPRRRPFWILDGETRAGFALVGGHSSSGRGTEFGLIEFYVAPEHRRRGVGMAGAHAVLTAFPGLWELAAHRRTPIAMAFWDGAIAALTLGSWERIERAADVVHRFTIDG